MSRLALLGAATIVDHSAGLAPAVAGYSEAMPTAAQYAGRVVNVGPTRTHTTVNAGIAAASALRSGQQRALVVVDPGTYNQQVVTFPYVDLVGATANPADVTIAHTCPTGGSPLNTVGGPVFVGGMTLHLLAYPGRTGSGIYSIHHGGQRVTIFEKLRLTSDESSGGIGMDGQQDSITYLIDCVIDYVDPGGSTNMHGENPAVRPLRMAYVRVTSTVRLKYNDLAAGQPDELIIYDCDAPSWQSVGANVVVYTDGSIPEYPGSTHGSVVALTEPPRMPVRGTA